jgi:hypothetical protein
MDEKDASVGGVNVTLHALPDSSCGVRRKVWLESLKRKDRSEDLGIDGKITLEWFFVKKRGGLNLVHLAQDRVQCGLL